MASNTNRNHIFILVGFIIYPLLLAVIARSIYEGGLQPSALAVGILSILKIAFIALSLVTLIVPWLILKGFIPLRPRQGFFLKRISPKTNSLIIGYLYIFSPVIYGLVLFFAGMLINELYYFVCASVLGALAWGFFNFRKA